MTPETSSNEHTPNTASTPEASALPDRQERKPALYAVLIAINKYEGKDVPVLSGCKYDMQKMHVYLRNYASANQLQYQPNIMVGPEAKRDKVIAAFQHYKSATKGDICVFYFSGHGSRVTPPEELKHLETDGKLQSIVCYDSRSTSRDITDKEISHLIWEATTDDAGKEKEVHFLAIFDSCHSESVTRGVDRNNVRAKLCPGDKEAPPFTEYYAHEQYSGIGYQRSPRVGTHVTLSASKTYQSAYEVPYQGIYRGVFTTSLLEVLENRNLNNITYGQLISLVNARIRPEVVELQNPTRDYAPVTFGKGKEQKEEQLLFGRQKNKSFRHYAFFDQNEEVWKVNLGAIHAIEEGQVLEVVDPTGKKRWNVGVIDVLPGESTIDLGEQADKEQVYHVNYEFPIAKLVVGIREKEGRDKPEAEFLDKVEALLKNAYSRYFIFSEPASADYWIDIEAGELIIRPRISPRPLFPGLKIPDIGSKESLEPFVDGVQHVARWLYLWNYDNPKSKLNVLDEFDITLVEYPDFKTKHDPGETHEVDIKSGDLTFSYRRKGKELLEPYIGLSIRRRENSKHKGSLWLALLFFDEQYGCTGDFFPSREFTQEDTAPVRLSEEVDGEKNYYINLWLPEELSQTWEENKIKNMFKIVISTYEFEVKSLELPQLEIAERKDATTRGMGQKKKPQLPFGVRGTVDWTTFDIPFIIYRP